MFVSAGKAFVGNGVRVTAQVTAAAAAPRGEVRQSSTTCTWATLWNHSMFWVSTARQRARTSHRPPPPRRRSAIRRGRRCRLWPRANASFITRSVACPSHYTETGSLEMEHDNCLMELTRRERSENSVNDRHSKLYWWTWQSKLRCHRTIDSEGPGCWFATVSSDSRTLIYEFYSHAKERIRGNDPRYLSLVVYRDLIRQNRQKNSQERLFQCERHKDSRKWCLISFIRPQSRPYDSPIRNNSCWNNSQDLLF